MRHVVYLLLVANLLYLGWNLSRSDVEPEPAANWPALPETVSPLVTLDEMQQQSAAGAEQPAAEPMVQQAETASAEEPELLTQEGPQEIEQVACLELGPFGLHDDLNSVATRLGALGLDTHERAAEVHEQTGYWVYLPVTKREAARKVIALLKRSGDKDYFLGRDNVIALGTFSDIERAGRRQEQLRKLGLEAVVAPHAAVRETWWLEFPQPGDEVMDDILQQHPDLQLRQLACL